MELITCKNNDITSYMNFVEQIYGRFPKYKDYSSSVMKMFLQKKGAFCRDLDITPVMVRDRESIVAVSTYITSSKDPGVLQIAFFEALEGYPEAVTMIMKEAEEICRRQNLKKITIGLNGHVNYGIGFLCDKFDSEISFGSSFNPPWYSEYFSEYHLRKQYNLSSHSIVSFQGDIKNLDFSPYNKLIQRIDSRFNYRSIRFNHFREDMKIYTDLNNICFKNHPFYFQRTYEEDYELFKELKYFIKEENLIFVQKGNVPVGYLLWYPDFNELMDYGEKIGVKTYFKNKIFSHTIKKMKIVEIAVIPEFENTGAIIGLFHELYRKHAARFQTYESSWIFLKNMKSRNFGVKWADQEYKHYVAYEGVIE